MVTRTQASFFVIRMLLVVHVHIFSRSVFRKLCL